MSFLDDFVRQEFDPRRDFDHVDLYAVKVDDDSNGDMRAANRLNSYYVRMPKHFARGALTGAVVGIAMGVFVKEPLTKTCLETMILGGMVDMSQYILRGNYRYLKSRKENGY